MNTQGTSPYLPVTDEREGLPSASGIERIMLCPGSWQAEQGLPETPSAIGERGNRIHAWLEDESIHLSDDEQAVADQCLRDRNHVCGYVEPLDLELVETRLWWDAGETTLCSGKADYIRTRGHVEGERAAWIIDYKTGYSDVIEATQNPQLMALAVLVDQNYGPLDKITVAIVQPPHKPSVAVYEREQLRVATSVITQALEQAQAPDAKRIPGEKQCRYCKAKTRCPEATMQVATIDASKYYPVASMTGEALAKFLELSKSAELVIEAVKSEAKRRLAEGDEIPGYRLKPGVDCEKITKLSELCFRVTNHHGQSITTDEFAGACSITKKSLKELVAKGWGLKGKELKQMIESLLDGLTETTQGEPQIERVK